jgi:hypothetical protein
MYVALFNLSFRELSSENNFEEGHMNIFILYMEIFNRPWNPSEKLFFWVFFAFSVIFLDVYPYSAAYHLSESLADQHLDLSYHSLQSISSQSDIRQVFKSDSDQTCLIHPNSFVWFLIGLIFLRSNECIPLFYPMSVYSLLWAWLIGCLQKSFPRMADTWPLRI